MKKTYILSAVQLSLKLTGNQFAQVRGEYFEAVDPQHSLTLEMSTDLHIFLALCLSLCILCLAKNLAH